MGVGCGVGDGARGAGPGVASGAGRCVGSRVGVGAGALQVPHVAGQASSAAPRAAERRRVAGHVGTIQALAGRPGRLVATVWFTSVGRPGKDGRHDARRRSGACCPPEIVGGFAVACARRGREQGEREHGAHLLMGFW